LRYFEESLDEEQETCAKEQTIYLCGELSRRLEKWDNARRYYQATRQCCESNTVIERWAREQEKLLPAM
jgi:hypothetical protein